MGEGRKGRRGRGGKERGRGGRGGGKERSQEEKRGEEGREELALAHSWCLWLCKLKKERNSLSLNHGQSTGICSLKENRNLFFRIVSHPQLPVAGRLRIVSSEKSKDRSPGERRSSGGKNDGKPADSSGCLRGSPFPASQPRIAGKVSS